MGLSRNRTYRMALFLYTERGIIEWLTSCGPANLKMDDYEQKVQNSSNCLVSKARCLNWSSLYARILKKWAPLPVKEWSW